jgi:hypothetical protein
MGLIKDHGKEIEDDPILKLNPTLYKVVQTKVEGDLVDSFQRLMED